MMKGDLDKKFNYNDEKWASEKNANDLNNYSKELAISRQETVPDDNVIYEHIIPPAVRQKWIRKTSSSVGKDEILSHRKVTRSHSNESTPFRDRDRTTTSERDLGVSIVSHDIQNHLEGCMNEEKQLEILSVSPRNRSESVSEEEEVTHAAFTWGIKLRHVELKENINKGSKIAKRPVSMPVISDHILNELSLLKTQDKVTPPKTYKSPPPKTYKPPSPKAYKAPSPKAYKAPSPKAYKPPAPKAYKSPNAKISWDRTKSLNGTLKDKDLNKATVAVPQTNSPVKQINKDASPITIEPPRKEHSSPIFYNSPEIDSTPLNIPISNKSLIISTAIETAMPLEIEKHDIPLTKFISKNDRIAHYNQSSQKSTQLSGNNHISEKSGEHIPSDERVESLSNGNISVKDALKFFGKSKSSHIINNKVTSGLVGKSIAFSKLDKQKNTSNTKSINPAVKMDTSNIDIYEMQNSQETPCLLKMITHSNSSPKIEQMPSNIDQKPPNIDQKPLNIDQKPLNIDQKPLNIDQKPPHIDLVEASDFSSKNYNIDNHNNGSLVNSLKELDPSPSKEMKIISENLKLKPDCVISNGIGSCYDEDHDNLILETDHNRQQQASEKNNYKKEDVVENGAVIPNKGKMHPHSPDMQYIMVRTKKRKVGSLTIQTGDVRDKELLQHKTKQPNIGEEEKKEQISIFYSSDENKSKQKQHQDIPVTSIDVPVSNGNLSDGNNTLSSVPVTSIDDIPISSIDTMDPIDQRKSISLKYSVNSMINLDNSSDDSSEDDDSDDESYDLIQPDLYMDESQFIPPDVIFDHPVIGVRPILSPARSKERSQKKSRVSFCPDDNFITTHIYLSEDAAEKEFEEQESNNLENNQYEDPAETGNESSLGKLRNFTPSVLGNVTDSLERARKKIDDSQTENMKTSTAKGGSDSSSVQLQYSEEGDYFSESQNTTGGAMLF